MARSGVLGRDNDGLAPQKVPAVGAAGKWQQLVPRCPPQAVTDASQNFKAAERLVEIPRVLPWPRQTQWPLSPRLEIPPGGREGGGARQPVLVRERRIVPPSRSWWRGKSFVTTLPAAICSPLPRAPWDPPSTREKHSWQDKGRTQGALDLLPDTTWSLSNTDHSPPAPQK